MSDSNASAQASSGDVTVHIASGLEAKFAAGSVWTAGDFASPWYADALREAGNEGLDFRRREVLFAVTAAESYLLEWVRDKVLVGNLHEINRYFPPGSKRGVRDKWKDVPKELASANLIAGVQELSGKTWATFDRLVDFRDGLIHASSSRPETSGVEDKVRAIGTPASFSRVSLLYSGDGTSAHNPARRCRSGGRVQFAHEIDDNAQRPVVGKGE